MDHKTQPPQEAQPAQPIQYQYAPQPVENNGYQPELQAVPGQFQPAQQPEQYRSMQPMQVGPVAATGNWQTGLFDCTPMSTCCLGTWLPCILAGQTSERMRDPANTSPDGCNADCMILCVIQYFTGCGWIYVMIKRAEMRQRFGIQGSGGSDCCTTYWCPCCSLIQQEKEVIARTTAAPITQAYQAQPGMQMPQK